MRVSIDFVGREQIKETRQLYRANFSDVQQLVNNFLFGINNIFKIPVTQMET